MSKFPAGGDSCDRKGPLLPLALVNAGFWPAVLAGADKGFSFSEFEVVVESLLPMPASMSLRFGGGCIVFGANESPLSGNVFN